MRFITTKSSFAMTSGLLCLLLFSMMMMMVSPTTAATTTNSSSLPKPSKRFLRRKKGASASVKPGCYLVKLATNATSPADEELDNESNTTTTIITIDPSVLLVQGRAKKLLRKIASKSGTVTSTSTTGGAGNLQQVFSSVFQGFTVCGLKPSEAEALKKLDQVDRVDSDMVYKRGPVDKRGPGSKSPKQQPQDEDNDDFARVCPPEPYVPPGVARVGGGRSTYNGRNVVWVLDSGVDATHPDLNVDLNLCFDASGEEDVEDCFDFVGHGTHVAGIIAGFCHINGVAPRATIAPVRVEDKNGDISTTALVAGLDHIAKKGKPGDVVNISLGGPGYDEPFVEAIKRVADRGIFVSIAAGNDGDDAAFYSPGGMSYKNVFTVSAVDHNDTFAFFSNFGQPIDFAAPGINIESTFPGPSYMVASGTSMAAPHIAGVLLVSRGKIRTCGYATNDPDGVADPIGCISA